ncbi:MAG: GNAT family N-acetyltransferase [Lachnospiraceae bacterium]|nr:GNAT family N-acetyltransferase [Lachnospiraceae bacterium]
MLRKMTIEDYEALFAMWSNTPNMGLRSLDDSKEGISRFLERNPNTNFVAYEGEILVGAVLSGHDGRRGYIYHTVVLPEYRRRGIASSLVDMAVEALRQEGITRVCLNVTEANEEGKKFWLEKGWEKKDFLGFYSKAITDKENRQLFRVQP